MELTRLIRMVAVFAVVLTAGACSRTERLPASVYDEDNAGVYARLPPQLQSTDVDFLYVTDRVPEHDDEGNLGYGVDRSESLAFGSVVVELDDNRSWDELVAWTLSEASGDPAPRPNLVSVTELGRFPDTPFPVVLDDLGNAVTEPEVEQEYVRVRDLALDDILRRLALSDRKNVLLAVHGVRTDFNKGVLTMAMLWHLLGRQGVPIHYSWPAGQSGLIKGYNYDRESGEFTIFHLKQILRALGRVPEIEKVILVSHSRGTDVLTSALRELFIEARAAGHDPREQYNIGHLVLFAPDMDMSVVSQRAIAEGLGRGVGHLTIYVSEADWVIGLAQSFFSSKRRLGQISPEDIPEWKKAYLRKYGNIDIIFYTGRAGDTFGHSYYQRPEILSDLFLLIRDRRAGVEHGRPLEPVGPHMWIIDEGYTP